MTLKFGTEVVSTSAGIEFAGSDSGLYTVVFTLPRELLFTHFGASSSSDFYRIYRDNEQAIHEAALRRYRCDEFRIGHIELEPKDLS